MYRENKIYMCDFDAVQTQKCFEIFIFFYKSLILYPSQNTDLNISKCQNYKTQNMRTGKVICNNNNCISISFAALNTPSGRLCG